MKLTKSSTVQDLFNQFVKLFPYLKLEFYSGKHKEHLGSPVSSQISHETLISELNPGIKDADFNISGDMTVEAFEKMMFEKYKLNVQVFRKSSDIWLQTTSTDHWSLEKQNGKGERSTFAYETDELNITDFDVE